MACVSCGTRKKVKDVGGGKPEWWCCRKCSRFNNRQQDGDTCRVCSTVEVVDEQLQGQEVEDQEEASISVGGEEGISVGDESPGPGLASSSPEVAAAPAGRFVQL